MTTVNHTITVTANGSDISALLINDSLSVRTSVRNRGDSASFVILNSNDTYIPSDWDEVTIAVNGTDVFGGYLVNRSAQGIGHGSGKVATWAVECRDWSMLLDQTIVDYGYTDTADSAIVADLFSRYLSGDSFDTASEVSTVAADVDVYFENIPLRDALNQLAALAGASWHIGPDKTIYWYAPTAPANAAFNIDTVSPNGSTSFDVLDGSIEYGVDSSTIINKVRVIGGEAPGTRTHNLFTGDGVKEKFGPTTYKPGAIHYVSYVIDGTTFYAYPSEVGYEPEDTLAYDGGNFDVIVNMDERYVTIKNGLGEVPDTAETVRVEYYALEQVDVTEEDTASQAQYDRIFEQVQYDESLNTISAQGYAQDILNKYAYGKETISFEVTEHGLLPGRLITINAPVLEVASTYDDYLTLEDRVSPLLQEDSFRIQLESYGESKQFLIQDVSINTVSTPSGFMVIASVTCGEYVPSLIDTLATVQQFSAGTNHLPARRNVGSLDRISNNLGEILAGRATFTDGGTAPFSWDAYNDHTGAVIGLEDNLGATPRGALYILNDGTVKAKVGYLDGLPALTGGSPSGWGIYTDNGYFQGVVSASEIIGGTVATTTPPINSSNPGVYLDSTGLYGYGTIGLTFKLPTNPADRPYFSSGTINNTVYEITTAAVLRTGTANPRVQIDNSGIFAYDSGGVARFTVDASTGRLTASQGTFSGTVSASAITGGTVTGGRVSGGTVTGSFITGGTVSASYITGGTVAGTVSQSGIIRATGTAFEPWAFNNVAGTTELHGHGLTFQSKYQSLRNAQGWGWINNANGHKLYTTMQYNGAADYAITMSADFGTVTSGTSTITLVGQKGTFGSYVPGILNIEWDQILIRPEFSGSDSGLEVHRLYTETTGILPQTNNTYKLGGTVGASKRGYSELWLSSPDNTVWKVTVSNAGALSVSAA